MTWTKRSKHTSWPPCLVRLLILAAFELSCCGLHPVWLASGGRPSVLFISTPLAPQILSLGYSESPIRFWQPLGTGVCCDPEEQEEHLIPGSSAPGHLHGAALGELSNNCQKKKAFSMFLFWSGFWECVFVLCWQWWGGFFFSNQVLCRSWACLLNGSWTLRMMGRDWRWGSDCSMFVLLLPLE